MPDKKHDVEESTQPKTRVTRRRRRLYEPPVDEATVADKKTADANDIMSNMRSREACSNVDVTQTARKKAADTLIKRYAFLSATTGLIPIALVDVIVGSAINLALLKGLSHLYGVSFSSQRAKILITSLLSGLQLGLMANQLLKLTPTLGFFTLIPTAASYSALTYAIGKVFAYHFELGGNLLDFEPDKMRKYFFEKYTEGEKTVSS